jgi:hypothetical protein
MLRTPSVVDSTGGAISEKQARLRNRMVKVADQAAELAHVNGLKVSSSIATSLMPNEKMTNLPTPVVADAYTGDLKSGQQKDGSMHSIALPHAIAMLSGPLLPTTRAQNGENRNNKIWARDLSKPQNLENALAVTLLPTPTTQDGKNNAGPSQFDRNTKPLNVEAHLLGTPRTSSANGSSSKQVAAGAPKSRLEDQVHTNWGRFEPAIRRWEATLGRPAPLPTKADGKDGNHRLSSKFTEWMMGLPEGWVTDVGLKRNDELKACGNGVVPQQAELALRGLLKGLI